MKAERVFADRRQFLAFCALSGLALAGPAAAAGAPARPLTDVEAQTIAAVAETILPATETAGAIEAGVPAFIGEIVAAWMDDGQRAAFLDGLGQFVRETAASGDGPFHLQAPATRERTLQAALVAAQAAQARMANRGFAPFLVWMKRLTVHGYYTSEIGASQELALNVMPGEYVACHHMAAGETSFSMDRRHIPFLVDNEVARIK